MSKAFKVEEVADLFNCSTRTIHQLIYDGKLKAFKIGNRHRITEDSVREYINQNEYKGDCTNEQPDQ